MDRFFGIEVNPVDIQAAEQAELPEKEQEYWAK